MCMNTNTVIIQRDNWHSFFLYLHRVIIIKKTSPKVYLEQISWALAEECLLYRLITVTRGATGVRQSTTVNPWPTFLSMRSTGRTDNNTAAAWQPGQLLSLGKGLGLPASPCWHQQRWLQVTQLHWASPQLSYSLQHTLRTFWVPQMCQARHSALGFHVVL